MCIFSQIRDQLNFNNVSGKLKVEITNIQGYKIYAKQLNGNYDINTSGFASGIYFIRLEFNNGQIRILKMVKQ